MQIPFIPYMKHYKNIKKLDSNEEEHKYIISIDIDLVSFSFKTYKNIKTKPYKLFEEIDNKIEEGTYTIELEIVGHKIIHISCLDLPRFVTLALLNHQLLKELNELNLITYCGCKEKMEPGEKCYCFNCGSPRPCNCFFWKNTDEMYSELHGCKCEYPAILGELFKEQSESKYKKCICCNKPICSGKPLLLGVVTDYNEKNKEGIISYRSGPFRDWTQKFKLKDSNEKLNTGDYVTFEKSKWSDQSTDLVFKYDKNICKCNEVKKIKNFTTCNECNGYKIIFDKSQERYIGKIKSYNVQKGFGFIDYHFGEIFFHKNDFLDPIKAINLGKEVVFSRAIDKRNKGYRKDQKKNTKNINKPNERTYAKQIVWKKSNNILE